MEIVYLAQYPAFIPELAAWHQAEWAELEPEETVATRLRELQSYGAAGSFPTALIAREGGELLGSALLVAHDLAIRPKLTPWLAGVYVKRERRGSGIASALVGAVLEEARTQGKPQLWLYTPHNASLYARLGFVAREHTRYRGSAITLMCLTL